MASGTVASVAAVDTYSTLRLLSKKVDIRPAQTYFQAIFSHQRRTLQMEVLQIINATPPRTMHGASDAAWDPLPWKDSFDVELLATIPVDFTETPFRFSDPRHRKDILVVGCWFMLRELELAACRWAHVYVENGSLACPGASAEERHCRSIDR